MVRTSAPPVNPRPTLSPARGWGEADPNGASVGEYLVRCIARLAAANIETARLDARLLLSAALGLSPDELRLRGEWRIRSRARAKAEVYLRRRMVDREPVSRILGRREFWSLDFQLSRETLDPRPDSETLVEAALALFPERDAPLQIADLGTGSGCLLLSVLHERPSAIGIGVDCSLGALRTAADNASRLGLSARARFVAGDWMEAIDGRFDLLLCNPPYIGDGERAGLAPEVLRHDPPAALFAGSDGFDAYRAIFPTLARRLTARGCAVIEIGALQAQGVRALATASGLAVSEVRRDLAGRDRCLVLTSM